MVVESRDLAIPRFILTSISMYTTCRVSPVALAVLNINLYTDGSLS
jgi:hypothetical protein